jgi:hypothetical protein
MPAMKMPNRPAGGDQQRRPQVRLAQYQAAGHARSSAGRRRCTSGTRRQDALPRYQATVIGTASFMISDGWKAEAAEIQPALRALGSDTGERHGEQQQHTDAIAPGGPARPAHGVICATTNIDQ